METKTYKLPKFIGKPLIELPKSVPQANFLEGDFGKAVLKEYSERVKSDYDSVKDLKVLSYEDNVVKGSNPFAVVLVNQIVSKEGLRTAKPSDLEQILRKNVLNLEGFYEDSALVLRNTEEPNKYLAENLMEQIKKRDSKQKLPVMIPLTELELAKDSNSWYKLSFKLKENAEIIYAPILNEKTESFYSKDIDEKIGLPGKLNKFGDRTLYTRNAGLSGFYLNWDLNLDCRDDNLAGFDGGGGRVVLKTCEVGLS